MLFNGLFGKKTFNERTDTKKSGSEEKPASPEMDKSPLSETSKPVVNTDYVETHASPNEPKPKMVVGKTQNDNDDSCKAQMDNKEKDIIRKQCENMRFGSLVEKTLGINVFEESVNERKKPNNAPNERKVIPLKALTFKHRKLIFDKSAIESGSFIKFLDNNDAIIRTSRNTFFVPSFVYEDIDGEAKERLSQFIENEKVSILNYEGVNAYKELVQKIAPMGKEKGTLCFILNAFKVKKIIVNALRDAGIYAQFFELDQSGNLVSPEKKKPVNEQGFQKEISYSDVSPNAFHLSAKPVAMMVKPISLRRQLKEGMVVYSDKKPIKLMKKEMSNSSSITYSTDIPGVWAKVFLPAALNTFTEEKCRLMLSKKVSYPGICWPISDLCDEEGKFVGVTVGEAAGGPIHLTVFKQSKINELFPDWTRKDLCCLAITILKMINYLHSMNVLMGCINPAAIRIVSSKEVYFVDTDNYQIEGFPSLIYNTTFTPPELLGRKMYLCDKKNEYYAVAVLLFMIMMPGKLPYVISDENSVIDSIKEKEFPFSNGALRGKYARSQPGMWRFAWSHLTPFKDPFYHTFQHGGKYETPENRLTPSRWEQITRKFSDELNDPFNEPSLKIFPLSFKRSNKEKYYECNYCHVEYPEFFFVKKYFDSHRICNMCIDKQSDVSFTCVCCGRKFFYTNRAAIFHQIKEKESNWKKQRHCADCKRKTVSCPTCGKKHPIYEGDNDGYCFICHKNRVYKRVSGRCGHYFDITFGEHDFFEKKGLSEPTRCPVCRKNKW